MIAITCATSLRAGLFLVCRRGFMLGLLAAASILSSSVLGTSSTSSSTYFTSNMRALKEQLEALQACGPSIAAESNGADPGLVPSNPRQPFLVLGPYNFSSFVLLDQMLRQGSHLQIISKEDRVDEVRKALKAISELGRPHFATVMDSIIRIPSRYEDDSLEERDRIAMLEEAGLTHLAPTGIAFTGESAVRVGDDVAAYFRMPFTSDSALNKRRARRRKPSMNEETKRMGFTDYTRAGEFSDLAGITTFVKDELFPAQYKGGFDWPHLFRVQIKSPSDMSTNNNKSVISWAELNAAFLEIYNKPTHAGHLNRSVYVEEYLASGSAEECPSNLVTMQLPNGDVVARMTSAYTYKKLLSTEGTKQYDYDLLLDDDDDMVDALEKHLVERAFIAGAYNHVLHDEAFVARLPSGQLQLRTHDANFRLPGGNNGRVEKEAIGISTAELYTEMVTRRYQAHEFLRPFVEAANGRFPEEKITTYAMPDGTKWHVARYKAKRHGMVKNLISPGNVRMNDIVTITRNLLRNDVIRLTYESQMREDTLLPLPLTGHPKLKAAGFAGSPLITDWGYVEDGQVIPPTITLKDSPAELVLVAPTALALDAANRHIDSMQALNDPEGFYVPVNGNGNGTNGH